MAGLHGLANPATLLVALSSGAAAYLLQLPILDVLVAPVAVFAVGGLATILVRDAADPAPAPEPAAMALPAPGPIATVRARARLSPRELLVAESVSKGLTDQQIAARLHVERSTVKSQLSSVKNKLGLNHRAEVAAWWVQTGTEGANSTPKSPSD